MPEAIIRKATRDDCKAIRRLIQELADFEGVPDGPKIDYKTLEKDGFDTEPPLFICYVAQIDDKIVGHAIAYHIYSTWCGKAMFLEDFYEAIDSNCCRLDFTVLKGNSAQEFYIHKGAVDLTKEEGLHRFRLSDVALKALIAADS